MNLWLNWGVIMEEKRIVNELPEGLVTTAQLCEMFKITRQAVYKWRKNGLPTVVWNKNGTVRYDINEVLNWLNDHGQISA